MDRQWLKDGVFQLNEEGEFVETEGEGGASQTSLKLQEQQFEVDLCTNEGSQQATRMWLG